MRFVRSCTVVTYALLISVLASCASSSENVSPGDSVAHADSGTSSELILKLAWEKCSLQTGKKDGRAECARASVPLNWSLPSEQKLTLLVRRVRPQSTSPRGQLWLLAGGPGGSAIDMEGFAAYLATHVALDVYLFEHRGVGESTRLGCERAEADGSPSGTLVTDAEWDDCLAELKKLWGKNLSEFSRTAAARDLHTLVRSTRAEGDPVFVYGVSYGTALASRYLELYPDESRGVILDSIVTPANTFNGYDHRYNDGAKKIFDRCAGDAFCAGKFGTDPWTRLGRVYTDIEAGHCASLGSPAVIRQTVRGMLGSIVSDYGRRIAMPAIVYRLARCSSQDVSALAFLYKSAFGTPGSAQRAGSAALLANIGLSEFWDEPGLSLSEIEEDTRSAYVTTELGARLARLHDRWPLYSHDAVEFPKVHVPLLMFGGGLDAQTPLELAKESGARYVGQHQHFVVFPDAPHGAMAGTPVPGQGGTCASEMLLRFVADPHAPPDLSCVSKTSPLDFRGTPALAQQMFGTQDLWE